MSLENKVVLVTGASAGIGEETAILFAKKGAKLGIVGRNEADLKKVAAECERLSGYPALVVVADLSTDAGCEETAKKTVDHFGRLDVLVNNVGVGARNNIQTADMEAFDRVFNTDVRGVFNLTRLLVPALVEAKGNVINVSSIAATMVNVGNLTYGMAKAALDHFTRLIALELAPKGVRVNAVSPGITVSTFVQRMTGYTDEQYHEWLKGLESSIPLGRVCTGEDIAKMITHLASEDSALVTGNIVEVDGGMRFSSFGDFVVKQINARNK